MVGAGIARPMSAGTIGLVQTILSIELGRAIIPTKKGEETPPHFLFFRHFFLVIAFNRSFYT